MASDLHCAALCWFAGGTAQLAARKPIVRSALLTRAASRIWNSPHFCWGSPLLDPAHKRAVTMDLADEPQLD